MQINKKLFLSDLIIILFLIYAYLWRMGPLNSMRRITISLYLCIISVIFYLFIFKVLKLNHLAALAGTLVFSFSGSDLSLIFDINRMPYPGTLPLFIGCFSFCAIKDKKYLFVYFAALILFILASLSIFMQFNLILVPSIRLFFNIFTGIITAYGYSVILDSSYNGELSYRYKRVQSLLYAVWLFALFFLLPVAYALFVLFNEVSRQLIPNILNYLVIFEMLLGWALIISYRKNTRISDIIPSITIFLLVADIFTYWSVNIH